MDRSKNYTSPYKRIKNLKGAICHTKSHILILEQLICNTEDQIMSPTFHLSLSNKSILSCVKLPSTDIPPYLQHNNSSIKIEPSSSLSLKIAEKEYFSIVESESFDSKNNTMKICESSKLCAEPSTEVNNTLSFDAIKNLLDSKLEKHADEMRSQIRQTIFEPF